MNGLMEEKHAQERSAEPLLIQRILAGERELFHDLIRPYERGAFILAYSILRNREDAEEAAQQAMMNIFSRLSQLGEVEKFKQWAMRVVENEAKMYRRKRRQHLYETMETSEPDAGEEKPFRPRQFADWRDLPSDVVEQKEVREAIATALADLPEMYREIFVLRDMQHLDVAETAQVLGIGESAVKTRLHRARLMMRESLTPMFANPKPSFWERWKGMNPWLAAKR
ncbi:MAG TPA: sigma-70 family RNA polymerase sigma factor [Candidatus Binatia bacterium]|nr:sigma-70 family RNA polymerase sigma factor [Candidatus Binatia bacterium]